MSTFNQVDTAARRKKIFKMLNEGHAYEDICKKAGVSQSRLYEEIRTWRAHTDWSDPVTQRTYNHKAARVKAIQVGTDKVYALDLGDGPVFIMRSLTHAIEATFSTFKREMPTNPAELRKYPFREAIAAHEACADAPPTWSTGTRDLNAIPVAEALFTLDRCDEQYVIIKRPQGSEKSTPMLEAALFTSPLTNQLFEDLKKQRTLNLKKWAKAHKYSRNDVRHAAASICHAGYGVRNGREDLRFKQPKPAADSVAKKPTLDVAASAVQADGPLYIPQVPSVPGTSASDVEGVDKSDVDIAMDMAIEANEARAEAEKRAARMEFELKKKTAAFDVEIKQLAESKDKVETAFKLLEDEHNKLRQNLKNRAIASEQLQADLEAQVRMIQGELEAEKARNQSLVERLRRDGLGKQAMDRYNKQLSDLQSENQELKGLYKQSLQDIEDLKARASENDAAQELAELRSDYAKLEKLYHGRGGQITALHNEIEKLKQSGAQGTSNPDSDLEKAAAAIAGLAVLGVSKEEQIARYSAVVKRLTGIEL